MRRGGERSSGSSGSGREADRLAVAAITFLIGVNAAIGSGALVAAAMAQPPQDPPTIDSDSTESGVAFLPEIWEVPDASRLSIKGSCLAEGDRYRLVVEYETDGPARYRALLVYAEPSHRLLFLQWNGAPLASERAAVAETPLAVFDQDSQRRYATFQFRPERDDRIRVEAITTWNERRVVLAGRVGDFCDFAVENRVHD